MEREWRGSGEGGAREGRGRGEGGAREGRGRGEGTYPVVVRCIFPEKVVSSTLKVGTEGAEVLLVALNAAEMRVTTPGLINYIEKNTIRRGKETRKRQREGSIGGSDGVERGT